MSVKWCNKSGHTAFYVTDIAVCSSYSSGAAAPQWARASLFFRFLDHEQKRITVGRTPLDASSSHRRDLYLTTHNIHTRQITMSPAGFEPAISASERPHTDALDRAATGFVIQPFNETYLLSNRPVCRILSMCNRFILNSY